jgi:hypothetical protein
VLLQLFLTHFGRGGAGGRGRGRTVARFGIAPSTWGVQTPRYLRQVAAALKPRPTPRAYRRDGMEDLGELRAATASIEQSSGYNLFDAPLALSPPLAPTASPLSSPPPALLASPPPPSPTRNARSAGLVQSWSDDEMDHVLALFVTYGPRFRKIARHLAGRSEDAVRQVLKRRGVLVPRPSPARRRRSSKAPRWSRSEDRRLLQALEATPRHRSGTVPWKRVRAMAGLNRLPHSLRNRLARLSAMSE